MSDLPFEFGAPWFLLLALVLPLVYWLSRRSLAGLPRLRRTSAISLRCLVLLLVIFALAEFRWLKDNARLAVIFVADLSESIPADKRDAERRYMVLKSEEREEYPEDQVGVVVFGKVPGIEWSPKTSPLELTSYATLIEPQATDIGAAIRLAVAAFPQGYGMRIVLLSDGNENVGAALDEVYNARAHGVSVDVVPITYNYPQEVSIEKLLLDGEQRIGEPFDVGVVIGSTHDTEARVELYQNDRLVSRKQIALTEGKNVLEFPGIRLDRVGQYRYHALVDPVGATDDSVFQNNEAHGFTIVGGAPRILVCAPDRTEVVDLIRALEEETITVDFRTAETLPQTIPAYFDYDAVVMANVPAHSLSEDMMRMFESLVKNLGLGFMMVGGEGSFGAGGYQKTPVERLLPVEMEIKHKKVLPNGAIAMVVHSCELGNGNLWARKVIQGAIKVLSPRDYAGVIHFTGGRDQWLFDMLPVSRRREMLGLLQNFNPGDMPSFQGIVRMARESLVQTPASIKHMIILSDGDPMPPPPSEMSTIRQNNITVSTICYGAHGTVPAAMKTLAQQGGGRFYYLQSPNNLPEIFLRETMTVTKSLISEEPFLPLKQAHHSVLQGIGVDGFPGLDGYVLTTPKETASILLVHPPTAEDPTVDPVLALWSYGLGKSIAFTSDAGARWGGDWVAWDQYRQYWSQVIRWVMRPRTDDRFRATRSIEGSEALFVIDAITLDGQLVTDMKFDATIVTPDFEPVPARVRQTAPGKYEVRSPISKQGAYVATFSYKKDGIQQTFVTGLSVPYSAEYRQLKTNQNLLRKIADAGGGRFHDDPIGADFFSRDFQISKDIHNVWYALLLAALCFFFVDVFIRRVVVDYRQAIVIAFQRTLAFLNLRQAQPTTSDGRLATLLERKTQIRDAARSRYRPTERPTDLSTPPAPAVFEEPLPSAKKPSTTRSRGTAAASAETSPKPSDGPLDSASGVFTSRLLQAKKRALRSDLGSEKDKEE